MNNEFTATHIHTKACKLSKNIFEALNLRENTPYHLCVGHLSQIVFLTPAEDKTNYMYLPKEIANDICVYRNACLTIWRCGETIYLGPIIGVFVHPKHIRRIAKGKPPLSVKEHMKANEKSHCLIYYFSLNDIDWKNLKTRGYIYNSKDKKWKSCWFSLPNVIYDRGLGFKKQDLSIVERIRQQFSQDSNVQFINSGSLKKWELYTHLSEYADIKKHLPKTMMYTSFTDALHMLDEYEFIFLKSSDGYGAREVISIKKEGTLKYSITYYKKRLKNVKVKNTADLEKFVHRFIKPKSYIIQQGITAIKMKKLHMDIRLLVQKDRYGEWKITYNRARITKNTHSIINSSLALKIINYEDIKHVYRDSLTPHVLPEESKIEFLAITIAGYIDQSFGAFGEIGIDMVIDEQGKIWFIEANSKPTKKSIPKIEQRTLDPSAQFLSLLEYAKYLQKVSLNENRVFIDYTEKE